MFHCGVEGRRLKLPPLNKPRKYSDVSVNEVPGETFARWQAHEAGGIRRKRDVSAPADVRVVGGAWRMQ